jgi:hypothetical protein
MAKKILLSAILMLATILFLPVLASAAVQNASIVNDATNSSVTLRYDVDPINAYIENAAGNPGQVVLQVCADNATADLSGKYGGFVYKTGNGTLFQHLAEKAGAELATFGSCDTNCCKTPTDYNLLSDYSVYTAHVYAVISDNSTIGSEDTFVYIPTTNGWFEGYFSLNDFGSTYSQTSGNVTVDVTAVYGRKQDNSYTSISTDKNYLILGICDNAVSGLLKWDCTSNAKTNLTASGVSLYTGITSPADNTTYTRYAVVNGIGSSFCIGPDLRVTGVTVVPSSTTAGQNVNITATVNNNNNVDVTTNFDVEFLIDGNSIANVTVTEDLSPSESTTASYIYATGLTSGSKTIVARVLDASVVADCNDGNDNSSTTLNIGKAYYVQVLINGTASTNFPIPGRPYNVSIHVNDSDGGNVAALVKITEKNGINLFAPIQNLSSGGGLSPLSVATFETNAGGDADLALIPLGNKLYLPEYANLSLSTLVGNYSLYLEIFNITTGTELQLSNGTSLLNQIDFTLGNMSVELPTAGQENSIFVYNHDSFVQQIIDLANQVYSSIKKWTGVIV